MMILNRHTWPVMGLLLLFCQIPLSLWGQNENDCQPEKNYSLSNLTFNGAVQNYTFNDENSVQLTVGQPLMGRSGSYAQGQSLQHGFWGFYQLEPQAPWLWASEGEFLSHVELRWEVVDDLTGPVVSSSLTKIYRNDRLLTTVPVGQTSYLDYNVFPGEFYSYSVVTSNDLGDSRTHEVTGFLNPNGRITGNVQTRQGVASPDVKVTLTPNLGRCLQFDGTDDYFYLEEKSIAPSATYTIEAWFRNVSTKDQVIFSVVDTLTHAPLIRIGLNSSGKVTAFHDGNGDGNGVSLMSPEAYNLSASEREWQHLALVHDSSFLFLYVNGQRVAEIPDLDYLTTKSIVELGKTGYGTFDQFYDGYLDDVRIWSIAKTRAEIRRFKDITLTGEDAGLMAYWKFDEQFGEKVYDHAAKAEVQDRLQGFVCGASHADFPTPVQLGAYTDEGGDYLIKGIYYGSGTTFSATPSKNSPIGTSLRFFTGDETYVALSDSLPVENAYTLEGWFKVDTSLAMTLFEARDLTTGLPFIEIALDNQGRLRLGTMQVSSLEYATSTESYVDEYWYHFAAVNDGLQVTLYVNGLPVAFGNGDLASLRYAKAELGRKADGSNAFIGRLDEFRFWNVARTQTQIQATRQQLLPGNERGIVEDPDLSAYWPFAAGQGEFIFDMTDQGHRGRLYDYRAQAISATDSTILNWDGDDIPLQAELFSHDFEPNARNISLDPSNVSVDRVDFTDISLLTVSGYVRYEGTDCFADSVEVLVNGAQTLPRTFTDSDGNFQVEFEPGSQGHILSFEKGDHSFDPSFIELPRMVRPIAGIGVSDNTKRTLAGQVYGGECGYSIGPAKVVLTTSPFCYRDTVEVDESGNFAFENIAPQHYQVYVLHEADLTIQQYFDQQGAQTVSLIEDNDTIDFMYRAPMQVEIAGLDSNDCGMVVVAQNEKKTISLSIFEQYGEDRCPMPSGVLTFFDDISDREKDSLLFEAGAANYEIKGGEPNLLTGGARPYQKKLQVIAKDSLERQATASQWAYVTGLKPRTVDFATTTPEIPFLILRDPPGDQSKAYFEESERLSSNFSFSLKSGVTQGAFFKAKLGQKFTSDVGTPFFTVGTEIKVKHEVTASLESTYTLQTGSVAEFSFETKDRIETEGTSDLYMGGALNILYGVTDTLGIDSLCTIVKDSTILFVPDGFNTTFIYSEDHIRGFVIPELEALNDSVSVDAWLDILDYNAELKEEASFEENISFDASTTFERSVTKSQLKGKQFEMELSIDATFANTYGLAVNDYGFELGTKSTVIFESVREGSLETEDEVSVGYTLEDSDFGDNFTINVLYDSVYATPVFGLVSGATSCPWEEGTLKRQGVQLTVDQNALIDVPSDQSAVFQLGLANLTETYEPTVYHLTLLQESNPDGAIVRLNGTYLSGGTEVAFILQPGEMINATLTIDKGPTNYNYENLQVMLFSACERDWAIERGYNIPHEPFASIQSLDVSFIDLCSPLEIASPQDNWVISQAQNDLLPITISDYDLTAPGLDSIKFQFRKKVPGLPFVNATAIRTVDLTPGAHTFNWDVSQLDDGDYEIRALSTCGGDVPDRITPLLSGVIDRRAPALFGQAQPADALLEPDDAITISFDEEIICGNLISLAQDVSLTSGSVNHINLSNTETGLPIEKVVSCHENTITIIPDIQNKFIEGQVLRVDVLGVEDQYGNVQTNQTTWEFLVVRNPLDWIGNDIDLITEEGHSQTVQRQIINQGAFDVHYSLSGPLSVGDLLPTFLPPWLAASPMSGIIPPGATETITFTTSSQIGGGFYEEEILAANSYGAPELGFNIRVLCPEPDWLVEPDDFDYSMIITAELIIDGDTSVDLYDRVGAFVDGELRGTGELRYVPELDRYQTFMTIFGNQTSGDTVTFQIWDASSCRLFESVLESFPFTVNGVQGTPVAPVFLTTSDEVTREIALNEGWTWFSLNLQNGDSLINTILSGISAQESDLVRNQVAFSQYTPSLGWVGSLPYLDHRSAYQIKQSAAQNLRLNGTPVDIETEFLPIVAGWNWISYLPQNGAEINEALSLLDPTSGDIIKNQTSFAQYIENIGWIGNLNFMNPNDGYLLYSFEADTLRYPAHLNMGRGQKREAGKFASPLDWSIYPAAFPASMTLTGILAEGAEEGAWLAAFVGDEVRGLTRFQQEDGLDKRLVFITMYGMSEGEEIRFEYYHPRLQRGVPVVQTFSFLEHDQYGDPQSPVVLDLAISTDIDPLMASYALSVFPNPFSEEVAIQYQLESSEHIRIKIFNALGQEVRSLVDQKQVQGEHRLSWDGTDAQGTRLSNGVYFLQLRTDAFEQSIQLILND